MAAPIGNDWCGLTDGWLEVIVQQSLGTINSLEHSRWQRGYDMVKGSETLTEKSMELAVFGDSTAGSEAGPAMRQCSVYLLSVASIVGIS
jgi:hypothetical protein